MPWWVHAQDGFSSGRPQATSLGMWKIRPMYFGFSPHDFSQTEHFLSTFSLDV